MIMIWEFSFSDKIVVRLLRP